MFYKESCSQTFCNITEKHLCQSLFFNEVAGLRPQACKLIKKVNVEQVLSWIFSKIFKNTFFTEPLRTTA